MPTIGAAVSEAMKEQFEEVARMRGTTASRLAASVIENFLKQKQEGQATECRLPLASAGQAAARGSSRTEQVFVRLDPFYYAELGRLARERDWYRGTYLANLFHAHVDRRPVLCDAEINAVRQVARQLADLGRNVNQIARKLNISLDKPDAALAADLELVRMLIDLETSAVKDLLKANLRGWGVSDGEA